MTGSGEIAHMTPRLNQIGDIAFEAISVHVRHETIGVHADDAIHCYGSGLGQAVAAATPS